MKKLIIFLCLNVLYSFTFVWAQASIGHVYAEVVDLKPISINNVSRLEFGDIEKSEFGKEVTIYPIIIESPNSTVNGYSNKAEISANITELKPLSQLNFPAIFFVAGQPDVSYNIILPSNITITNTDGTETMSVTGFNSLPSKEGKLDQNGKGALSIGATLNVKPKQKTGLYQATQGFEVIVNYN